VTSPRPCARPGCGASADVYTTVNGQWLWTCHADRGWALGLEEDRKARERSKSRQRRDTQGAQTELFAQGNVMEVYEGPRRADPAGPATIGPTAKPKYNYDLILERKAEEARKRAELAAQQERERKGE